MSKKTAEQRRAEGWRECWGIWHYEKGWRCGYKGGGYAVSPKTRLAYRDEDEARDRTVRLEIPRRFWRRKKQPAALKPGDRVRVEFDAVIGHNATSDNSFFFKTGEGKTGAYGYGVFGKHFRRLP